MIRDRCKGAPPRGAFLFGEIIIRPHLRCSDFLPIVPADSPFEGGRLAGGLGAAGAGVPSW